MDNNWCYVCKRQGRVPFICPHSCSICGWLECDGHTKCKICGKIDPHPYFHKHTKCSYCGKIDSHCNHLKCRICGKIDENCSHTKCKYCGRIDSNCTHKQCKICGKIDANKFAGGSTRTAGTRSARYVAKLIRASTTITTSAPGAT